MKCPHCNCDYSVKGFDHGYQFSCGDCGEEIKVKRSLFVIFWQNLEDILEWAKFGCGCVIAVVGITIGYMVIKEGIAYFQNQSVEKVLDGVHPVAEFESMIGLLEQKISAEPNKYLQPFLEDPLFIKDVKVTRNIINTDSNVTPYEATITIGYTYVPRFGSETQKKHVYTLDWSRSLQSNRGKWSTPIRTDLGVDPLPKLTELVIKTIVLQGPSHL